MGMSEKKRELSPWEKEECAKLKAALDSFNSGRSRRDALTQGKIAEALDMTQGSVSSYLNGYNALNLRFAAYVAAEIGVPMDRFSPRLAQEAEGLARVIPISEAAKGAVLRELKSQTGEAVLIGDLSPWDDSTPLDDDEVELPLYKEVELAAGSGRTAVQEMPGRKLRFSYATLRAAGVDPAAAVCAQLKGNSMEPLIMSGATVGIDQATTQVVDGEIYALEHDGMLRVKYLYRLPGGGLRLRSFNREEYQDEEYTSEEIQSKCISIIGWVFWWSTLRTRGAFKR